VDKILYGNGFISNMGQDKVIWYGLGFGTAESSKENCYDAGQSPYHEKLKGNAHGIYMNISKDSYGLIGIIYG
tara:strand:+ start:487 stop:705 length:219 start_codon:yes stop_codon:yes gene_type:complete